MFENLRGMASLLSQAKQIGERAKEVQAELAKRTAEGESGAGAVRVTVNGKFEVLAVKLDRPLIAVLTAGSSTDADTVMIEDLIVAASNDAMAKMRAIVQEEVSKATGGLNLPGMEGLMGG